MQHGEYHNNYQHQPSRKPDKFCNSCHDKVYTTDKTDFWWVNKQELELVKNQKDKPNLGMATTRELLNEITARIEIDGQLDYKTVGSK